MRKSISFLTVLVLVSSRRYGRTRTSNWAAFLPIRSEHEVGKSPVGCGRRTGRRASFALWGIEHVLLLDLHPGKFPPFGAQLVAQASLILFFSKVLCAPSAIPPSIRPCGLILLSDWIHYLISLFWLNCSFHWIVVWRSPKSTCWVARIQPHRFSGSQQSRQTAQGLRGRPGSLVVFKPRIVNVYGLPLIFRCSFSACRERRRSLSRIFRSSPEPGESRMGLPSHLGAST